jgi:hypothetical protein
MIVAAIQHAQSGELLTGNITLVAFNATARDSVTYPVSQSSIAAVTLYEGRLSGGIYTVEIRLSGYETWRRDGVVVEEEPDCHHTLATSLSASLVPL